MSATLYRFHEEGPHFCHICLHVDIALPTHSVAKKGGSKHAISLGSKGSISLAVSHADIESVNM